MDIAALIVSIFALVVSGVGWFVNGYLRWDSQRRILVATITDKARLEIARAVNDCVDWLAELSASLPDLQRDIGIQQPEAARLKRECWHRFASLVNDRRNYAWAREAEEYEMLFPRFTAVRIDLLTRIQNFTDWANGLPSKYQWTQNMDETDGRQLQIDSIDLSTLVWDFKRFLQHDTLAEITRQPISSIRPGSAKEGFEIFEDGMTLAIRRVGE